MHSAAQQSGGRQSVVPDNGHVHQHATSGPQQPDAFGGRGNGRGSKRSLSQQALQHRAERAGHDAMQPDMFAIHGISQDPADSMSGPLH